jgi:hypothetical protein
MITNEQEERVRGWFAGRLPEEWQHEPARIVVDREEITIVLSIDDVELSGDLAGEGDEAPSAAALDEARAGRASAFREETRGQRMKIAREAEHRYERKVSWGLVVGEREVLWTHVAAPVMTRLRQPQRLVLDTLVDAGVARSRSEALAWCVRLVGQHEADWLTELRDAMGAVADVRSKGPAA